MFGATPRGFVDNYQEVFAPLARITASCELTKTRYFTVPYWNSVELDKNGNNTVRRRGCRIYSYSYPSLTIDCRGSSSTGSATWRWKVRRSDKRARAWVHFSRRQSTMGQHHAIFTRRPYSVTLTEYVSPGTMITVGSVGLDIRRLFVKRQSGGQETTTLTASWPY